MSFQPSDNNVREMEVYLFSLFLANDAAPIRGKVMLVKQAFLIVKEVVPKLAHKMKFFPYLYGPYSNPLAEMINSLIDSEYVRTYKENGDYWYQLTKKGRSIAETHVANLSQIVLDRISQVKRNTQELGLSNVLKMVYREYPDYAVYSRGREVYGTP